MFVPSKWASKYHDVIADLVDAHEPSHVSQTQIVLVQLGSFSPSNDPTFTHRK